MLNEFGELPFISIIAFSNRATLKNISVASEHTYVDYQTNVSQIIKRYKEPIISKYQARKIFEKIDSFKISGLDAKINHAEHIEKGIKHQQTPTTKENCPKCGKKLILREGKYGDFLGCCGYPNCKYTQKL